MGETSNGDHRLTELMNKRWSPRGYSDREVREEQIHALLEAARWAPSANNAQPWRFVVTRKGDERFAKILDAMSDWNKRWVQHVPVLVLNLAQKEFSFKQEVNPTAQYDLGQAVFAMALKAVDLGLVAHQMSGFDHEKVLKDLDIPDGYEAVSTIAFGYLGDDSNLPDDLKESEKRERIRKPIDDLLF
ncbi:MAG: nitroreductase family protein [Bacteroidales bacterium]|nr:nitroreductase family protein [Bacteroidales bacterium]